MIQLSLKVLRHKETTQFANEEHGGDVDRDQKQWESDHCQAQITLCH